MFFQRFRYTKFQGNIAPMMLHFIMFWYHWDEAKIKKQIWGK